MNYPAAMFWMNFCLAVINLAGVIYVWWTNKEKVTSAKFDELKGHINQVESSVKKIEVEVKHRPDCQYHTGFEARMDKMNVGIATVKGEISSGIAKLEGRMEGMGSALDLIQSHLLNGGK